MTTVTAIYDGNCVICNTTRRVVRALDWFRRVEFLDLHDTEALDDRYPWLARGPLMGEIHVVDAERRVFRGFYGTRRMLRAVPLGWPLWALLRLPILGTWLGPRVYAFIARHRYAINRLLGVDRATIEREEAACDDGACKTPPVTGKN
jgi:predicted DCC family thiol-disulfide oxidoreductase YuxK